MIRRDRNWAVVGERLAEIDEDVGESRIVIFAPEGDSDRDYLIVEAWMARAQHAWGTVPLTRNQAASLYSKLEDIDRWDADDTHSFEIDKDLGESTIRVVRRPRDNDRGYVVIEAWAERAIHAWGVVPLTRRQTAWVTGELKTILQER